jgi:aminoglycoside phosphotransferase (APT) family kinase protein
MDRDSIHGKTHAVLDTAAARLGVPAQDARLLRLHGNASYALPSAGLVIRIATNPRALGPVTASIAVTRWLAGHGFPCTVPADIDDQPFVIAGYVVSAWRYVPTADTPAPTGAEMGEILRELHAQGDPPYPLPGLDDPFASITAEIGKAPDPMSPASLSWLQERITSLRRQWSVLNFPRPAGLIHGDAHIGNLMRAASGQAVLGDWDHVATGPREWDLAQIHYMDRRFGRAGENGIDAFTAAYGWDIRTWPGLETLIAIREIWGLRPYIRTARDRPAYSQQLAYRLRTLQSGDTQARWKTAAELAAPGPGRG